MYSLYYRLAWKLSFIGLGLISFVYAKSSTHISLMNDIKERNVLVTYYSAKCPFSQQFLKLWKGIDVHSLPTVGSGFASHLIDCEAETELCAKHKIKYYPSIRFHQHGSHQPQVFRGRRTAGTLLSFLGKAMLGSTVPAVEAEALGDTAASPPLMLDGVMELTDANFDSFTAGGPVFVKFFTDWCPHCKLLKPLFPQLAPLAKRLGVALGQVNCESQPDTCSKQAVPHYPYMALFGHGRRLGVHEADNTIENWQQFLQLKLQELVADRAAAVSEGVLENWYSIVKPVSLTWSSFDKTARATEFLFVKFFAPWCSHCQRLAPVWERLAQDLAQEFPDRQQLVLGRVDCTEEAGLCNQQGVRAYPSLLLYQQGHLVDSFRGLRDLAALSDFLRTAIGLRSKEQRSEL
ncbi:hypothetical protein BOX15_Mlig024917g1 [Macrostomum lignano]|uniref:Thioredoxin domain-containing protein n=1 Tax=Macrostomum lignano TaxID=282301 RepID=A0A267EER0_9PLAT|nr:hypothetical protein BOX15_Mlig024917g1 [Macrostomum lignano]